ncbi:hypothetical protein V2P32_04585 [Mycoplasma sp. 06067-C1-B144P-99-0482-3]|uniref:hypothetical protein n=1 Tax=Mycoplasma sp. 06067-C1-B144P-99-0482-3 TaxID=3117438 RepID=UPI003DA51D28
MFLQHINIIDELFIYKPSKLKEKTLEWRRKEENRRRKEIKRETRARRWKIKRNKVSNAKFRLRWLF